jgi:hypothetical protein
VYLKEVHELVLNEVNVTCMVQSNNYATSIFRISLKVSYHVWELQVMVEHG